MSRDSNIALAERLLAGMSQGIEPNELAKLFSRSLSFEIQGDEGVLPWIGRKTGRAAAAEFFRNLRALTEPVKFNVEDVLGSERRAVIVGDLASRLNANGRVFKTQFAIILSIADGEIVRFQLLEDSFGLSRTVRD